MGFFSWKCADTQETIWNIRSGHPNATQPVYLLQPGKDPIEAKCYDGYGMFGGTDAYIWLAEINLPEKTKLLTPDETQLLGIDLECGHYYSGSDGCFCYSKSWDESVKSFTGTYLTPQEALGGKTPQEMISAGLWERKSWRDLLVPDNYQPLKFSHNRDALYEELPASEICESQGFF